MYILKFLPILLWRGKTGLNLQGACVQGDATVDALTGRHPACSHRDPPHCRWLYSRKGVSPSRSFSPGLYLPTQCHLQALPCPPFLSLSRVLLGCLSRGSCPLHTTRDLLVARHSGQHCPPSPASRCPSLGSETAPSSVPL